MIGEVELSPPASPAIGIEPKKVSAARVDPATREPARKRRRVSAGKGDREEPIVIDDNVKIQQDDSSSEEGDSDSEESELDSGSEVGVTEIGKGVTRPPRFVKLRVVDGMISVIEDPFSEEEEVAEESEDEEVDDAAEADRADLLVKPASKKRRRELEQLGKSNEIEAAGEELIQVRGEGRYFGKENAGLVKLCINCHRPGHMAADCPTIVTCGEMDDHLTRNCPKTKRCSNCNKLGHSSLSCLERRRDIYCTRCRSSRHGPETCPSIWCYYETAKTPLKEIDTIFCYNCAAEGHYGDECPRARPAMQPLVEMSAFSKYNLPVNYRLSPRLQNIVSLRFASKPKHGRQDGSRKQETNRASVDSFRPPGARGGNQDRDHDRQKGGPRNSKFGPQGGRDDRSRRSDDRADYGGKRRGGYANEADRSDWAARKDSSDSRYDYTRGRNPVVPGSVDLSKNKEGKGFKGRFNAGKEAFKRLVK